MKHYYDQLGELRIVQSRKATLLDRKQMLTDKLLDCTSHLKESVVSGGVKTDKMLDYEIKIEELDNKINDLEEEEKLLQDGLDNMENILKNITGIEEKIFRLYFIENKNPIQIAMIVPCDLSTVYRYIRAIKKKYEKLPKNTKKNMR